MAFLFCFPSQRRRLLAAAAAATALAALSGTAHAERVIRIVVPFGAGATQDTVARTFSNELGQALGATVIVDNRAGAGGTVGTAQVARAAPDGNTLVLAAASHHLASHLYARLPYDPVKDFVGVSFLGRTGYVVGVPASSGITSIADLIAKARAQPGVLNYASAGNGSASHLATASLAAQAGVQLQHIPFKSTGDATTELLAGRVQVVTGATIGMLPLRSDPRVKLLAYSGTARSRFLPDLPTVAESGLPGYAFDSWLGLLAPAGTPTAEVERINAAVRKVLADPVVQERLARVGVEAGTLPAADFQQLLRDDAAAAGRIVQAAGVRIE
ncbi:tripartite tricarboxylate transporter substrate binding protein [Paracidovorax cattleyae]|uniref:Tripartite-type tricarboxylate transporter, receptor component TctC n=1 Tax=Paracidovorax cattleyae TaxID=80868 RepID=A0A1H0PE56_9BURK|nr:tripartite tricarboxylate transporter substrate binding protein [Paracidovorax cattleyae]AVS76011.1 tripartite tricarboxylate transporter substrate binding protein [Paracidovorax cattleyae]SDP03407.1 Tripartite-type tricarboxylate transporter, receptor component TctC [Paracidovorax cattleyae]